MDFCNFGPAVAGSAGPVPPPMLILITILAVLHNCEGFIVICYYFIVYIATHAVVATYIYTYIYYHFILRLNKQRLLEVPLSFFAFHVLVNGLCKFVHKSITLC